MVILNIEVVLKAYNNEAQQKFITREVERYLMSIPLKSNKIIKDFTGECNVMIGEWVKAVIIGDLPIEEGDILLENYETKWFLYTLDSQGPILQLEEEAGDDEGSEEISTASHMILPSADLFGLWESLYYEDNIKQNLLNYAETMMKFSDKNVDMNLVSCNRVILLHGPPGTGKTSLCKALAHKLSIRMQNRYDSGLLVEINSHSLFSKWFSESGKLVTRLFAKIREIVQNPNVLVCLLIDEVESLAHARDQCMSGSEPSDSIRVVNALLTQLDLIRRFSNVLILTTSNITESIDVAFIDRADIKQYLGLPTIEAVYKVYTSSLQELIRVGIIQGDLNIAPVKSNTKDFVSKRLWEISELSLGLSGRSLRKIPFLAPALYLRSTSEVDLPDFVEAMEKAVEREKREKKFLSFK